jgi:hypothetical protein
VEQQLFLITSPNTQGTQRGRYRCSRSHVGELGSRKLIRELLAAEAAAAGAPLPEGSSHLQRHPQRSTW